MANFLSNNKRLLILYFVLIASFPMLAISKYTNTIDVKDKIKKDSITLYKDMAIYHAELGDPEVASQFLKKYIKITLDRSILNDNGLNRIKNTTYYLELKKQYLYNINPWGLFYLYAAFVGFFIAFVINMTKESDRKANFLISLYVFIHSVFIIHNCIEVTNYNYDIPDSLLMSTSFSFLYGPLLYFYFRRVSEEYQFKLKDSLHLLPSIGITILLIPVYSLPYLEKLKIMFGVSDFNIMIYINTITITKFISLVIYGILIFKSYKKQIKKDFNYWKTPSMKWIKNILIFNIIYIISYFIYGALIIQGLYSGFLYHIQVICMSSLVLYIGYMAYVKPKVLRTNSQPVSSGNKKEGDFLEREILFKYKKSGLTEGLSLELKKKLLYLLNEEKIYKNNNLNLAILAEELETSRHNASQLINEHFGLNFFELINKYRVYEAMEILRNDYHHNLNIIDVAYEVGFNNKVTFNKSFKKENNLTPSAYIKYYRANSTESLAKA